MSDARAVAWRVAVRSGLGSLCARLARGRLQILCYHGFSFLDEHRFRGSLFMSVDHLERRIAWLRKNRFAFLPFDEAVERLQGGRIRERETVLTIDDGFYSVHALAAPVLLAHRIPATIYVTTYYVTRPNPIFRLAIQYIAWKSTRKSVETRGLLAGLSAAVALHGETAAAELEALYLHAEAACTEDERVELAREFGRRAGVDYDELVRSRRLSLMAPQEIRDLASRGFDIQLHTHRHRLPLEDDGIAREIVDNREILGRVTDRPLVHLCYPSGLWDSRQWPALAAADVRTATTCIPGFNRRDEPLLGLRRFLDREDIPDDEFAAEMLAVKDLVRRVRRAG